MATAVKDLMLKTEYTTKVKTKFKEDDSVPPKVTGLKQRFIKYIPDYLVLNTLKHLWYKYYKVSYVSNKKVSGMIDNIDSSDTFLKKPSMYRVQELIENFIDVMDTYGELTSIGDKYQNNEVFDFDTEIFNTTSYWICKIMSELDIPTTKFGHKYHKHRYDSNGDFTTAGDIYKFEESLILFIKKQRELHNDI
jgi:hypothetical protein